MKYLKYTFILIVLLTRYEIFFFKVFFLLILSFATIDIQRKLFLSKHRRI